MLKLAKTFLRYQENIIILGIFLIFFLLIFKDPFSDRTLIPNFEPYPDTFFYINPAINLVQGNGFNISREGREIIPNVPPLYSLILTPVFIIKSDPRMAYYANFVLSFISLGLFYAILRKLFTNNLITYFLLVLYITNYFIYWVPTLVMAENLAFTLFIAMLFFLLSKVTKINLIIVAGLAVGIYATKYAGMTISASLIFLYLLKISISKYTSKIKVKLLLLFLAVLILFYLPLAYFEQVTKGGSVISQAFSILVGLNNNDVESLSKTQIVSNPWFGSQYMNKNFPLYFNSLIGGHNKFLWDNTPLVPKFVAIGGLIGILTGIFIKNFRFFCAGLVIFLSSSVLLMSVFYTFDARYIHISIPILLLGFGILLTKINNTFVSFNKSIFNYLILFAIVLYLFTSFIRIKSQISLNLRYAETPWYYISVLKLNEYFTKDMIKADKRPVVISALPPFLVDFYSNGNYTLLPLSSDQEFRNFKELVWGPNDYTDLPKLYTKYMKEGYDVYVSRYGLGNESYTNRDFRTILEKFDTELVLTGCYEQCNIYRVRIKE